MSFIAELKRRNVFRVAIAYLALAWLLTEVADTLFPAFGIPDWGLRFLVIVFALGFVPALIFSWAYELTPEGLKRDKGVVLDESITPLTAKRLDKITIGLIVFAVAFVLADRLWLRTTDPGVFGSGGEGAGDSVGDVPSRVPQAVLRDRPAIAVLPFTNMSGDAENEYFTQGIHDDILTQLSKISALDVIARTSVMQYVGTAKTIPDIGQELAVESVVEGGVRRAGNRVRINVQLIQAESNTHLWAETYDHELTAENIFAIQTEIAQEIAASLRATLTAEEGSRISQAATGSLTAYYFYLKGREAYARNRAEDNEEAIRLFRQALELDPEYARAWAGLGDAFAERVRRFEYPLSWADSAVAAGQRAIDIDPGLADGYKALGLAYSARGDYEQGLKNYLKTVELDPSHLAAVRNIGSIYFARGAFPEYHLWRMRSFRLSPNAPGRRTEVAWSYWNLEEYDLAERWAREATALEAEEVEALTVLSAVASHRGDFERGIEIADQILNEYPASAYNHQTAVGAALFARDFSRARSAAEEATRLESLDPASAGHHWHYTPTMLGFTLLATGERERGMEVLAEAQERTETLLERTGSWRPVWEMASIHAVRGEVEEAIRWAEQAYESNGYRFPRFIELDPIMDNVREEPRFRALVSKMEADVRKTRRRIEREEVAAGLR